MTVVREGGRSRAARAPAGAGHVVRRPRPQVWDRAVCSLAAARRAFLTALTRSGLSGGVPVSVSGDPVGPAGSAA